VKRLVHGLGLLVRRWLITTAGMTNLGLLALRSSASLLGPPLQVVARVTVRQVYFTGIQALPLTGFIAFLIGAVVMIQAVTQLSLLDVSGFAGDLIVIAVLRELGPLIAAVIVIGRSGTAMAAELANMRQRGEVDELDAMGIDPIQYLFLPRLAGAMISLFALMIYFDLLAVAGGYVALAAQTKTLLLTYLQSVADAVTTRDILLIPAKAILFGLLFAVVSCYRGFTVGRLPTEIPRAATGAVVTSLVGIFVVDAALALAVYG
jgi:phospholipid/cholesterol/gamma-HCH transport system permease protein